MISTPERTRMMCLVSLATFFAVCAVSALKLPARLLRTHGPSEQLDAYRQIEPVCAVARRFKTLCYMTDLTHSGVTDVSRDTRNEQRSQLLEYCSLPAHLSKRPCAGPTLVDFRTSNELDRFLQNSHWETVIRRDGMAILKPVL